MLHSSKARLASVHSIYIITFINIFNNEKNNLLKILSSLIVKFSADVQAENFYFQVKFINCYLKEIISFT